MAAYYRIQVEQGATWRRRLTVNDETGSPVNLTGYTARMHARESTSSATPLLTLTTGGSASADGITIDGAAGRLALLITAATTTAITWRHAVYDLEIVAPDGDVTRLLKGEIEVDREITR